MTKKIILGFLAGIIGGLFGVGGGMILIPSFVYFFKLDEKRSRATAAAAILPMVIISSVYYYQNNYIDWELSLKCIAGGLVGGAIGVGLLKKISPFLLEVIFIALLLYVAIRMIMG